ncbi:28S ribosomal protein S33, mitochondrial [Diorhabda carinulata]|uniref:28S ribosomal protein S33, mitochondrial n=1 Tax=Diorhabda sublineata TaxID=1163346 RepID=UPI0024E0EC7E|nr:28S ribosomal protein S33, mitochondrial [Diorhabda sublineata]XP_057659738.1 28S ribosomal protein S33, mitochondrial [Diorhabda carinulata]
MSKYAKYTDLIKQTTEYARRMNRLSNRIFGEVVRPTNAKSMKVVKLFSDEPIHLRKEVHAYYPRHIEIGKLMMKLRYYGLYRDEHADFQDEMDRMRALRGKAKHIRKTKAEREKEAASKQA